eukprot:scaffold43350_cov33-Prasinocladus_malaysianus.AAC.1
MLVSSYFYGLAKHATHNCGIVSMYTYTNSLLLAAAPKVHPDKCCKSHLVTHSVKCVNVAHPVLQAEEQVKGLTDQVKQASAQIRELEKANNSLGKEKELLENKLERLEKARTTEIQKLQGDLADQTQQLKAELSEKEAKVSDLVESLGNTEMMLNELRAEQDQAKMDMAELDELREMKEDIERKEKQQAVLIEAQAKRLEEFEQLYKEEQVLRKRYFNQMEDMKGKIRVYARVRPILGFEEKAGQKVAVQIPDELSLCHAWKDEKKPREYNFDSVFEPGTSQDKVFEDTKYLVQSALDGYNVCIFAYGQTGSGKTFTIYGNEQDAGLTPRAIDQLFRNIEADSHKFSFSVKCYMLELYQDTLLDLLLPGKRGKDTPKLEIKKDPKGMTQAVTKGKLTFVDLAGSERIKKSCSAGEQLKEAQAINKSLSALGDVISALASEQGHIPYRNHKLTMLLSDCLGGNAKTLMFVNVSPTDGNLDETQNSLQYATRVRTIKNDASKNESNKEMQRLKQQLSYWREQAGLSPELRDVIDLKEISDSKDDA